MYGINFKHKALIVSTRYGSEGSHRDPYAYVEYTIHRGTDKLVVHMGLEIWAKLNGERCSLYVSGDEDCSESMANRYVKKLCGYTLSQLQRINDRRDEARARALWRKCPTHHKHVASGPGYPGEHITACMDCGAVLDYTFNRSAIE